VKNDNAPAMLTYAAYVLRLWQVETENGAVWRASLDDPHSGEYKGFADLNACYQFLRDKINSFSPFPDEDDPLIETQGE
jgi:hypothetical protein